MVHSRRDRGLLLIGFVLLTLSLIVFAGCKKNQPPEIASVGPTEMATAMEDQVFKYTVKALDPDTDDKLIFSLNGAPSGMTITSDTGSIAWTPDNSNVGTHTITVEVQDDGGLSAAQSFTVTVANVNDPPAISSTAVITATEDQAYSYTVKVTDPDVSDTPTFSLDKSPAGMTIDQKTGLIKWTPDNSNVGNSDVTVRVRDAGGLTATQNFTLAVANVNDPPKITSTAVTTGAEDQPYSYSVKATDPDVADTATFSLDKSPAGMTIDQKTGLIKWTPDDPGVGENTVTVRAQDVGGLADTQTFKLTVTNRKYAVIVGITDYRDSSVKDLLYDHTDANTWYSYLSGKGYTCWVYGDSTNTYTQHDGNASESNVRNAIRNMVSAADSNDYVALVICGHGGLDSDSNRAFAATWDYGAASSGQDGLYYDTELADDFESCVAAQLFVFLGTCSAGGMDEVVQSPHIGHVYMAATCAYNGYGYEGFNALHGVWTNFFLVRGLQGSGHESWDMATCYDQAYSQYQTFYTSTIEPYTGDFPPHDWNGPSSYDHPTEFDTDSGTQFFL